MPKTIKVYTDEDANPELVRGKPVAIIGYGSQGLTVMPVAEAAKAASLVALLTPDMSHETIFASEIAPNLEPGDAVLVAHGFTVLYERIQPAAGIDVILVAPKGPGDLVRREYERGAGVPCLFAVRQDATGEARERALAYASLIGGTTAGAIETSFREETETDLFGEQAVLCGGATELVAAGFETLVNAGYQPEIAYYECLHELKLIVDLLYEGGFEKMHEFVSETAIYGDLVSGPRVINDETRARMKDRHSGRHLRAQLDRRERGREEEVRRNAGGRPVSPDRGHRQGTARPDGLVADRREEEGAKGRVIARAFA